MRRSGDETDSIAGVAESQQETAGASAVPRPLAVQLYTLRNELTADAERVFRRIAEMGIEAVEPVSPFGVPVELREACAGWAIEGGRLRALLDRYELAVCSAHTTLPEGSDDATVMREQELLGNDLMIVSSLTALAECDETAWENRESLMRVAERFNVAAERAARQGMRVGFHNHYWEWDTIIDGRPAFDVFWDHVDSTVVAEVDLYWAQVAGRDPREVIAALGSRAELVHVKDGPLQRDAPNMAVGAGSADVAGPLTAAEFVRWHIVEFDECETDVVAAVAQSADWLVDQGLSTRRHEASL
jgi:sugar phosphate isomerase/epimerase